MSRAFIDADRSSMTMRSWRSYSGKRCVDGGLGADQRQDDAAAASTCGDQHRPVASGVVRRESEPKRRAIAERRRNASRRRRWAIHRAAISGTRSAHGARSGRRNVIDERRSSDMPPGPHSGARLRAQELHQLVRRDLGLLAQRGGEPCDQFVVVFRVPVVRRRFDGATEFLFGAGQPGELLLGLPVSAALRVEREAGPEVRRGLVWRLLRLRRSPRRSAPVGMDPELRRDDARVVAREDSTKDRHAIEPRLGDRVRGARAGRVARGQASSPSATGRVHLAQATAARPPTSSRSTSAPTSARRADIMGGAITAEGSASVNRGAAKVRPMPFQALDLPRQTGEACPSTAAGGRTRKGAERCDGRG